MRELKKLFNLTKVHLSYDYGRFGSQTFKHNMFYKSEDLLMKFQNDLYGGEVSFPEYEQSYTTLFSTNPAYVALVQMALSSRGRCLVQIGWGSSIGLVNKNFKMSHSRPYCINCINSDLC